MRVKAMLCVFVLAMLAGCQTFGSKEPEAVPEEMILTATLDKSVYQPGEAVVVTVELFNNSGKALQIPAPCADNLDFYFGRLGDPERMARRAVQSSAQKGQLHLITLEADQKTSDTFLVTRLTQYEGPMIAQVHYDPQLPMASREHMRVFSEPMPYDVAGQVLFHRDADGLIMKEDAIAVASRQVRGTVTSSDAGFVQDASGYYACWVNLQVQGKDGRTNVRSFLVDPYRGRVWRAAKPFGERLTRDRRRVNPDQRPPRQGPVVNR